MANSIKNYIDLGRALQEKYEEVRRGIITRNSILEEHYKPLTVPLSKIAHLKNTTPSLQFDSSVYLSNLNDKYYGIRVNRQDKLFIGNSPIHVENNNVVLEKTGETYKGTPGLWELLTKSYTENYTPEDLEKYKKIILSTHAYRRNNDPASDYIKRSAGYKYMYIIQPILLENNLLISSDDQKSPSFASFNKISPSFANFHRKSPEISPYGSTATRHLRNITDHYYGVSVHYANNYYIGNTPIRIENDDIILLEETYEGTEGLWELLTKDYTDNYTPQDLHNYKRIILLTHVYRKYNDPKSDYVKRVVGLKYIYIIKPILEEFDLLEESSEWWKI